MPWNEFVTKKMREAGSSKHDKAAAMKRAGEEWRGHRSNPGINLKTIAFAIGGVIVLTKVILSGLAAPAVSGRGLHHGSPAGAERECAIRAVSTVAIGAREAI